MNEAKKYLADLMECRAILTKLSVTPINDREAINFIKIGAISKTMQMDIEYHGHAFPDQYLLESLCMVIRGAEKALGALCRLQKRKEDAPWTV